MAESPVPLDLPDTPWTCAECGYDLHALPVDSKCPECGQPKSRAARHDRTVVELIAGIDLLGLSYLLLLGAWCVLPWLIAPSLRIAAAGRLRHPVLVAWLPPLDSKARMIMRMSFVQVNAILVGGALCLTQVSPLLVGMAIMAALALEIAVAVLVYQVLAGLGHRLRLQHWISFTPMVIVIIGFGLAAFAAMLGLIFLDYRPALSAIGCLGVPILAVALVAYSSAILDIARSLNRVRLHHPSIRASELIRQPGDKA